VAVNVITALFHFNVGVTFRIWNIGWKADRDFKLWWRLLLLWTSPTPSSRRCRTPWTNNRDKSLVSKRLMEIKIRKRGNAVVVSYFWCRKTRLL